MNRGRLKSVLPSYRRAQESDMQEELESLKQIAGPGELGSLALAAENARQTWHWTAFDGIFADVRYAFRTLHRQPGFVAVAVVSLALGIGANSAIFSFADALLWRPLPVVRPSEIVSVSNSTPDNPVEGLSYPDFRELREKGRSFSGMVAYRSTQLGAGATAAAPPQIRMAMMVSEDFFTVLGIAPSPGRAFLPEEGKIPGRDPLVILGYDFWNSEYGGDRSVIGRTIRLNGIEFSIIGVAPESFPGMDLLFRPAMYVSLSMSAQLSGGGGNPLEDRGRHDLTVKGRLRAGATRQAARAELATLGENLERAYPKTNQNRHVAVRTEMDMRIQQAPMRLAIVTMSMVLVGLVLIIACANVANLMLARARARSREIAIRLAIGAGRPRLVRQLMVESLAVALLGGIAGLGVAYGCMQFLSTLQVSDDIPIVLGLELDSRVLAFSLFAALASCLLFGLVPALKAARTEPLPALKSMGDANPARRRMIGRNALVVSQIALAMVLLVVAGMFLDGFRRLLQTDPGFRTEHLISMGLDPSVLRYSPGQTRDFYRKLVDRVRALPGVKSVAMAEAMPFSPNQTSVTVLPEGYQLPKGRQNLVVYGGAFDENYFSAMKVGIVRGRAFSADDRAGSRRVAIVNEEFARTYWPNQDAIGKRLNLDRADGPAAEVVGVAKTGRYLFPTESPRSYVYLPFEQTPRSRMTLIAESSGDPASLAALLRDAVRTIDADQPVLNLRTVASYKTRAVSNWLIFVQMFASMGLLGLTLAMVGLYGVMSYSVSRRTREIGIRMAIGASRSGVLRLVLRQGLVLAAAGIAIGGVLAAAVGPPLARGAVGPGGTHVAVYLLVPLALLVVSLAACYVPARRAAMLDPTRAVSCD